MQFSNLFTILALAMSATAVAVPAAEPVDDVLAARGGGGGSTNQCSTTDKSHKKVCCSGNLVGCVIIVGDNCSGKTYCCDTSAVGGLKSPFNIVGLVGCTSILG